MYLLFNIDVNFSTLFSLIENRDLVYSRLKKLRKSARGVRSGLDLPTTLEYKYSHR